MVKPILYSAELSPAVRGVWLTARAINLALDNRSVNLLAGEHLQPDYVKMNRQHTVPTLDDNGFILWDSHAICTYLIDKYGRNDHLYPKDSCARARINQRLYFDVGVAFAGLKPIVEAVFFKGATEYPAEIINGIHLTYGFLETFLKSDLFMAGNSITVADYCLVATISTAQLAAPILEGQYPKLAGWFARMKAVPFYDDANGKFVEKFGQIIASKLEANRKAAADAASTKNAEATVSNDVTNDAANTKTADVTARKDVTNDATSDVTNDISNDTTDSTEVTSNAANTEVTDVTNNAASSEIADVTASDDVTNGVASDDVTNGVASNDLSNEPTSNEVTDVTGSADVTSNAVSTEVIDVNNNDINAASSEITEAVVTNDAANIDVVNVTASSETTDFTAASNDATNAATSNDVTNDDALTDAANNASSTGITDVAASTDVVSN